MFGRQLRFPILLWSGLCVFALPVYSQNIQEDTLSGPDSHETTVEDKRDHLFGDWGGLRPRLLRRGVKIDLQYISDSLWNIKSDRKRRLAMWNRVRGTVDIDLGTLARKKGWYFHATGL